MDQLIELDPQHLAQQRFLWAFSPPYIVQAHVERDRNLGKEGGHVVLEFYTLRVQTRVKGGLRRHARKVIPFQTDEVQVLFFGEGEDKSTDMTRLYLLVAEYDAQRLHCYSIFVDAWSHIGSTHALLSQRDLLNVLMLPGPRFCLILDGQRCGEKVLKLIEWSLYEQQIFSTLISASRFVGCSIKGDQWLLFCMDTGEPSIPEIYRILWQDRHQRGGGNSGFVQRVTSADDRDSPFPQLSLPWEEVRSVLFDSSTYRDNEAAWPGTVWVHSHSQQLIQYQDGVEIWKRFVPHVATVRSRSCETQGKLTKCVLTQGTQGYQLIDGSTGRLLEDWSTPPVDVLFDDLLESEFSIVVAIDRSQLLQDPSAEVECAIYPRARSEADGGDPALSEAGLEMAKQSIDLSLSEHDQELMRLEVALTGKHEMLDHCLDTLSGALNDCFISGTSSSNPDILTIRQRRQNRKRRTARLQTRLLPILGSSSSTVVSNAIQSGNDSPLQRVLVLDRRAGRIESKEMLVFWFQVQIVNKCETPLEHTALLVSGYPYRSTSVQGVACGQVITLMCAVSLDPVDDLDWEDEFRSMLEGRVCVQYALREKNGQEQITVGWEYQSLAPHDRPLSEEQCLLLASLILPYRIKGQAANSRIAAVEQELSFPRISSLEKGAMVQHTGNTLVVQAASIARLVASARLEIAA